VASPTGRESPRLPLNVVFDHKEHKEHEELSVLFVSFVAFVVDRSISLSCSFFARNQATRRS
jgi:hypothetical protein